MTNAMKITIIGTGYVGLVTGACLAEVGNDVLCVDIDARRSTRLNSGEIPIHEPGLEPIVERNDAAGRLQFTTDIAGQRRARRASSSSRSARRRTRTARPTCSTCWRWRATIGAHMTELQGRRHKSTVPVGTADKVRAAIVEELEGARRRASSSTSSRIPSS